MTLLADTDVMVDILRQYEPALAWLRSLGDTELQLPGYVALELVQGCRDRAETRRLAAPVVSVPDCLADAGGM